MNRREAGRLGSIKTKEILQNKAIERREIYYLNPTPCKSCLKPIPYPNRKNKFCSRSCSAAFNNLGVVRHGSPRQPCLDCGAKLSGKRNKFCSHKCHQTYRYNQFIESWLKTGKFNNRFNTPTAVRKFLTDKYGHCCMICKNYEWMGVPIPLVLDHIDGNSENNYCTNLRLICGNCNMLLPTFAGRNKGNGRKWRRDRYVGTKQ